MCYNDKKLYGGLLFMIPEKIESILLKAEKPSRYIGGEMGSIVKDKSKVDVRFAFCFPDSYDIGMSHLGMKILYSLTNSRPNYWCERVFAPWVDFEKLMRENDIPLYALESLDPIKDFDFIGFTLQYELSYSNILNMLDLAKIPIFAKDRGDELTQIVVAGGPCVCNPEPLADFFDLFILGEGEEVNLELLDLYHDMKLQGKSKSEFLREACHIEGIYVPSLYSVSYNSDGTINAVEPIGDAPKTIKKRIIKDFDTVYYPDMFVVPYSDIVHNRASVEVLRGCVRSCRFCQAGFIYRPFREKSKETILKQSKALCENTGYEELSLSSLSTSDHSQIEPMLTMLMEYANQDKINLSLPSLRVDNFTDSLLKKISSVKKSGLTFAPEASTQRLRDVINKNVSEEEIMNTCRIAFEGGYSSVKLYFMMGLPTETDEDILGIIELADRITELYYSLPNHPKGKVRISGSVATFVPKPFTPFQFEPQATREQIEHKQSILLDNSHRSLNVSWHSPNTSILEATLARGDRRLCNVIYTAWKNGAKFDSWDECFNYNIWEQAFKSCSLDMGFYANRLRPYDEVLPWDHLDYLVSKEFLIREHSKAVNQQTTTKNCKLQCAGCGVNTSLRRACFEYSGEKS